MFLIKLPKDRLSPGRIILVNNQPYKVIAWDDWLGQWKITSHNGITPKPSKSFSDSFTVKVTSH